MDRRRALLAASQKMGYEPIEYVTFDGSTIFDTGVYGNNTLTIEVKFRRTNTASNVYLYGVSASPRLSAYLGQSGYWRYSESAYPTFNTKNTNVTEAKVTPTETRVGSYRRTYSSSAFTTKFTMPLGGHTPKSGVRTPQFIGEVYYFRMSVDGKYILDWTPAISNGVEGFWDNVTNEFVAPL